jgi:hypothetical protein
MTAETEQTIRQASRESLVDLNLNEWVLGSIVPAQDSDRVGLHFRNSENKFVIIQVRLDAVLKENGYITCEGLKREIVRELLKNDATKVQ